MTTATDWDVRDTETNDRLTVTEVQARIDQLDGAATEAPVQIEPWIPRDPHARERCRCGEYHESALIAPASDVLYAEGSTIAAEMVRGIDRAPGWPTWLGDVHRTDATMGALAVDLHAWADNWTALDIERTVVEPVEVDYSYQQSEAALYAQMVVSAAEEHVASVYDELAPERIAQDSPADVSGQNREATPPSTGSGAGPSSPVEWPERQPSPPGAAAGPPHRLPPPPPPPAETAQRAGVLAPLAQQSAQADEPEPREPWWRKEPVIAAGIVAAMAALVVLA